MNVSMEGSTPPRAELAFPEFHRRVLGASCFFFLLVLLVE